MFTSRSIVSFRSISPVMLLAVVGAASPAMADFNYTDFSNTNGLVFNGVAQQFENAISVTPPVARSAGSVWHQSMQNVSAGFTTDFSFRVRNKSGGGSDGFAFVIQNSFAQGGGQGGQGAPANAGVNALGAGGGAMGYASNLAFPQAGVGINNSIAFEFDMHNNQTDWSDFNSDNHISVHSMGPMANQPNTGTSLDHVLPTAGAFWEDMSDGQTYNVRITYTPGIMSFFMKRSIDAGFGPALMAFNVDLTTAMQLADNGIDADQAFVGFTAGTGGAANVERHEILNWSFSGNTIPTPGAAALVLFGSAAALRRRR